MSLHLASEVCLSRRLSLHVVLVHEVGGQLTSLLLRRRIYVAFLNSLTRTTKSPSASSRISRLVQVHFLLEIEIIKRTLNNALRVRIHVGGQIRTGQLGSGYLLWLVVTSLSRHLLRIGKSRLGHPSVSGNSPNSLKLPRSHGSDSLTLIRTHHVLSHVVGRSQILLASRLHPLGDLGFVDYRLTSATAGHIAIPLSDRRCVRPTV